MYYLKIYSHSITLFVKITLVMTPKLHGSTGTLFFYEQKVFHAEAQLVTQKSQKEEYDIPCKHNCGNEKETRTRTRKRTTTFWDFHSQGLLASEANASIT